MPGPMKKFPATSELEKEYFKVTFETANTVILTNGFGHDLTKTCAQLANYDQF